MTTIIPFEYNLDINILRICLILYKFWIINANSTSMMNFVHLQDKKLAELNNKYHYIHLFKLHIKI